ncbi:MAG: outer membrane lipoprotein-sorting protein [Acidobacteriota bacterium]
MRHPPAEAMNRWSLTAVKRRCIACTCLLLLSLAGCEKRPEGELANTRNENSAPSSGLSAAQVIERYRALDNSRDSTIKMRAHINSQEESTALNAPRQIELTMYRKREPDGRVLILAEFTAPDEERDRDGLITVFPDGRIEAVRYVQSTDSFLVASDAISEDALFGLTAQELADGQPEKYDFALVGEDTYEGTALYRLEGKLKQGAESKFPRVVLLISKENFAALQAEFYDNHNELARRLAVAKAEQIAGHWTRVRWTIDNFARRKKIDFEAVEVKHDQNLRDSIFTREHLKRIASR